MERPSAQAWLVILLRIGGVATFSAFAATLLPTAWMQSTHAWLGLGELPRTPVFEYLARSIALLYGFHGCLMLLVSTDVVRFRPIVVYLGLMNVIFGAALIVIDLTAGMPWFWTAAEGPPIVAMGLTILLLVRSVPTDR